MARNEKEKEIKQIEYNHKIVERQIN